MESALLTRLATLETVSVAVFSGVDGQGKPSYAAGVDIQARVQERDQTIDAPDGSKMQVSLSLWLDANQDPRPAQRDKITRGGVDYIVVERRIARTTDSAVHNVRLRCRVA
jgi:hypothetical protein